MIAEDFHLFRRFVCSKLESRPELQVVCEVSDGLEAVRRAVELQPDLILLDVGLPTLNGIEAARRIRDLAPESKIIFLSQETSPDIVQEGMRIGAWGYVFKTHATVDLLPAIDATLSCKRFVSSANSGAGVMEEPQSRQTKSLGNTKTSIWSAFLTGLGE